MNLDELTLGQIKQLTAMVGNGCATAKQAVSPSGRAVVVVDRGWIFAGDMSTTPDGYLRLDNAVWVFRWESIGFSAVIKEWKSAKVDIRKTDPIEIPADAVVFRVPVESGWGIK